MSEKPLRAKAHGLRAKVFQNVCKTSPLLTLRLVTAVILFLPFLIFALVVSWIKMLKWRKVKICQNFIRQHRLAFENLDPATLVVRSKSGGVSNANQIWQCRKQTGEKFEYFVKIFVAAGSFWAKHMSLVSPFPQIYGGQTHERFTVDMISRVQLADRNIPVPKLVAYDAVEKVMVTEYIQGENVDYVLMRIAHSNIISAKDSLIIQKCGEGLAHIHNAGFSLIDTQPVNCIWQPNEEKIYFTDLEFCTREDKRVWDVGFFLCFIGIRIPQVQKKKVGDLFLNSYQKERAVSLQEVEKMGQELKEYYPVFQTILDMRQFTPEELFEQLFGA